MMPTILGAIALAFLFVGCSDRLGADQLTTGGAGAGGVAVGDAGDGGTGGVGGASGPVGGAGGRDNVDGGPVIVTPTIDAGTPAMLVAGPAKSIALDGTHVYWTDRTTNGIFKVAKSGGPTITLVPERTDAEGNLAVGPTHVCWARAGDATHAADGAILKLPIEGGTPVVVASQQYIPSDPAVDATNVYWTTYGNWFMAGPPKGTVMKASLETGLVTMLAENRTGAGAIAVDATAAYWSETGGGDTTGGRDGITKVPLAGGSPVELFHLYPFDDGGLPYLIGIDGSSVYFRGGGLRKVPLSGGNTTTVLSSFPLTGAVGVDGSHVYWVSGSAIMRVSVDGGTPEAIPTADQPSALAVDETRLYWTAADGAVMTLAKP